MHNFELNASRSRHLSEIVSWIFLISHNWNQVFAVLIVQYLFWNYLCLRQSEDGDGSGGGGGSRGGRINGNDSTNNNMDVIFLGSNGHNNQKDVNREAVAPQNRFPNKYSSCKTLQRKLELKVERAKRNYSQQNRNEVITVRTANIFWNEKLFKQITKSRKQRHLMIVCLFIFKGHKKQCITHTNQSPSDSGPYTSTCWI